MPLREKLQLFFSHHAHPVILFRRKVPASKATEACLSPFGWEGSVCRFLMGSRVGWHVESLWLLASRGVLTLGLVDLLCVVFRWSALVRGASLSAFIFAHLG
jgi:hypothetical protein